MSLGALRDMEEEPSMWIADQWQDYELLDCGGGEKGAAGKLAGAL